MLCIITLAVRYLFILVYVLLQFVTKRSKGYIYKPVCGVSPLPIASLMVCLFLNLLALSIANSQSDLLYIENIAHLPHSTHTPLIHTMRNTDTFTGSLTPEKRYHSPDVLLYGKQNSRTNAVQVGSV